MFKRYLSMLIILALLTCGTPVSAIAETLADPTPTATILALPTETAEPVMLSSATEAPGEVQAEQDETPEETADADLADEEENLADTEADLADEEAVVPEETDSLPPLLTAPAEEEDGTEEESLSAAVLTFEDFSYTLENGVATITDYTGTDAEVLLPGAIGESTSVVVAAGTFADCAFVELVCVIDETVSFESGALTGCSEAVVLVGLPGSTHEAWAAAEGVAFEPLYVEPESISVKDVTIGVGQSAELDIELQPENAVAMIDILLEEEGIVSISEDGVLTGLKVGSTRLAVVTENEKEAICTIKVVKAPTAITLAYSSGKLGVGETFLLTYKLTSGSCADVTFSSDDESVVSVDPATGMLTAKGVGTAVITAATHNGKKDTCQVTVYEAPTALTLPEHPALVAVGQKIDLEASLDGFYYSGVSYTSSDTDILTVDADGCVTAVGAGNAVITASTAFGDLSASADFTVIAATGSVSIPSSRKMGVKDTYQLEPVLDEGTTAGLTYSTSRKSVATVSADGLITAKARGTATITVKTHNGKKDTIKVTVVNAPKSISLSHASGNLGVGETFNLKYSLTKNTSATVTFSSDRPDVVSVDPATGFCKGLTTGSAVITATTHNGLSDSCTVTVFPAPTSVSMEPETIELGVKMKASVRASINEGSCGRIEYVSSNESIATVDQDGVVTAKAEGTVQIIAGTYVEGLQAVTNVTVLPAPSSVTVPSSGKLGVKDTYQIVPKIPEGSMATFTYSTSRKSVATVSADGLITAKARGTATITVKTHNGKKDTIKVTVVNAPKSISLSHASGNLGVGETFQLSYKLTSGTASTVTYTTDAPGIAAVDPKSGLITAISPGTAIITAKTHNGMSAACSVTVNEAPTSITIGAAERTMGIGQTQQLPLVLSSGSSSLITWSSSNPDAVSVNSSGLVKALSAGTAIITAKTYIPGLEASTTITVLPAPDSFTLAPASIELNFGETYQIVPLMADGFEASFTYASSDDAIASVDANGLLSAGMRGTATITVTSHNKKTAKLTVTVYDPNYPESISFEPLPEFISLDATYQIQYSVTPSTAGREMIWTSTEPAIATVSNEGLITTLSPGVVTLNGVSAHNANLKISYTLIVLGHELSLEIPEARTDIDGIEANLERIRALETSAYSELNALYKSGAITQAEYTRRTAAVKNAFKMYAFPWMTEEKELYWYEGYSEGGLKDFKPGIVYFGMPYTQSNRNYNVDKALDEGYYHESEDGNYYLMDNDKISSRNYVGSDCSSFVSMAYFGTKNYYDSTKQIYSNSTYKTIPWEEELRTGDLLCKVGHVAMFLYYVDLAKTQIMIIEQGGGDENTNTVSASIKKITYYTDRAYIIRRLSTFAD